MKRFMVISSHRAEDCNLALQQVLAIGYLTHFDWGCKDNVHTGWAVIEANDKSEAMMSVPTFLRPMAQVVRITKFKPEHIQAAHHDTAGTPDRPAIPEQK